MLAFLPNKNWVLDDHDLEDHENSPAFQHKHFAMLLTDHSCSMIIAPSMIVKLRIFFCRWWSWHGSSWPSCHGRINNNYWKRVFHVRLFSIFVLVLFVLFQSLKYGIFTFSHYGYNEVMWPESTWYICNLQTWQFQQNREIFRMTIAIQLQAAACTLHCNTFILGTSEMTH